MSYRYIGTSPGSRQVRPFTRASVKAQLRAHIETLRERLTMQSYASSWDKIREYIAKLEKELEVQDAKPTPAVRGAGSLAGNSRSRGEPRGLRRSH